MNTAGTICVSVSDLVSLTGAPIGIERPLVRL